jgi:predicted phosphoadenosine phosphosulfate sulfurtransferase
MDRIFEAIFSSRYSIHDLSRCQGEGDEALARFNMPLELGIAMALRFAGSQGSPDGRHDWLVLVPKGHSYYKFASDLAGYDAKEYAMDAVKVIPPVMAWLATRQEAAPTGTPRQIQEALPRYMADREALALEWGGEVPWKEIVLAARRAAPLK